jgi:2-polyprenyl-3-methyl-5-hydroxy-6-metoxy-1,4-benzoquinol methylase
MNQRAEFVERECCIACGSDQLHRLSEGRFADEPLRGILASQHWGEHPLPFIEHASWRYVACGECGQRFHQRILAPAWMQRLYARWETHEAMQAFAAATSSRTAAAERGLHFMGHALRLTQLLRPRMSERAPRLLDYGCGNGEFVAICRALAFDAHGVDWAAERRDHALLFIHHSLGEALRRCGAEGPHFDAVTLFEVLEHLADPRAALEQVASTMVPGAVLILETPDTTASTDLRSFDDYLAIGPLGHINGFTPASLRALAERCGFRATAAPAVWLAGTWPQAARQSARNLVARWRKPTTSQYFVRV